MRKTRKKTKKQPQQKLAFCQQCKIQFTKKKKNHVFCCSKCRNKHHNFHDIVGRLLRRAKTRAIKKGLEFNITKNDISIPVYCPIFKIKLEKSSKYNHPNSYSLDRIDNTKGYIKGNVHIISWRANNLKKDGTHEEFEKLAEWEKIKNEI